MRRGKNKANGCADILLISVQYEIAYAVLVLASQEEPNNLGEGGRKGAEMILVQTVRGL